MTLDEKVAQLINTTPAIPRLNVPAYDYWSEGLHGIARSGYATLFPQAIGMAATWDAPLINQISTTISTEARAKYNEAVRHDIHSIYYGLTHLVPEYQHLPRSTLGPRPGDLRRRSLPHQPPRRRLRQRPSGRQPHLLQDHRHPQALRRPQRARVHPPQRERRPDSARSLGHLPPRLPRHHH